jgi:hypothetical protein
VDDSRLAALARSFANPAARRTVLGAAVTAFAGAVGLETANAKKKHKHHHKKHHATCTDHKRNGNETDVDCGGGKCPRCADGKICDVANDCVSGTCESGQCVACTPKELCGSNDNGSCRCDEDFQTGDPVCNNAEALGLTVDDCAKCPEGTESCVTINGLLFNCYQHCASV